MNITTVAVPAITICSDNNLWLGIGIGFVASIILYKCLEIFPMIGSGD